MLQIKQTNTILYCEKWQATVAFYRDTLGLSVTTTKDWFVEFQLTPHSFVSVANAKRASIHSSQGAGLTLAWRVQNIAHSHDYLRAQGVVITPIKKRWGAAVAYLHDPEGNRIELWEANI